MILAWNARYVLYELRSLESANDAKIGEENRVGEIHTMHAFGLEHMYSLTVDLLTQDVLKKLANVPKADYNYYYHCLLLHLMQYAMC